MNLEEFRKALSSDATEENAQLKRQLSGLQTEYHEKLSKLENENDSLKESCRVLCNRCFTLTRGVTCLFCGLDYPCPHMPVAIFDKFFRPYCMTVIERMCNKDES